MDESLYKTTLISNLFLINVLCIPLSSFPRRNRISLGKMVKLWYDDPNSIMCTSEHVCILCVYKWCTNTTNISLYFLSSLFTLNVCTSACVYVRTRAQVFMYWVRVVCCDRSLKTRISVMFSSSHTNTWIFHVHPFLFAAVYILSILLCVCVFFLSYPSLPFPLLLLSPLPLRSYVY